MHVGRTLCETYSLFSSVGVILFTRFIFWRLAYDSINFCKINPSRKLVHLQYKLAYLVEIGIIVKSVFTIYSIVHYKESFIYSELLLLRGLIQWSLVIRMSDISKYCLLWYLFNIPITNKQLSFVLDISIVWIYWYFFLIPAVL